jgi:Ca-activated chloride channel homolog
MNTTKDTKGPEGSSCRSVPVCIGALSTPRKSAVKCPLLCFRYLLACISCITCLVLCANQGLASPSSALREYKAGKYDDAFKEYERLLQKKSDDPRLHFNAGAAAYRNRLFEEAAKQFNATIASPDLRLQGLAYYNEGNALYHLGEASPDPKKRTESWEKALQNYQSSMRLNPQDADTKFNYEFVKRKLAELKQQQKQQSKQDEKQNQDQQKQQQQQQDQTQQEQGQEKQQQQQQDQKNHKQDSSQQQQAEEQKQQETQQQAAKQAEQQKQDQQQAQQQAGQAEDKSDGKEQESAATQATQMTPAQAEQLLDAQKADEKMLSPKATGKASDRSRPIRDW